MIRTGNAPCSWGVLEFDLEGEAAGYVQVLNEMVETGYVGTELGDWDFMPTDPDMLAAELTQRGLTMLGAFVPVQLKDPACHEPGVEAALKVARLLPALPRTRRQQRQRSHPDPQRGPRDPRDGAERRGVESVRGRRRALGACSLR
jgi:sugar phosphate isomerase/epimerase